MQKLRHVLGISGGKDSAALAIYMRDAYPTLDIEYYFCDTDKELDETYRVIENLENYLGKKIERRKAAENSPLAQFDHFLRLNGGFLPSSNARWCTNRLKIVPFEQFVGDDPVVSYVGIRDDENRDAYISTKPNIQAVFPFRRNMWSEDVITKALANTNLDVFRDCIRDAFDGAKRETALTVAERPLAPAFNQTRKLAAFHDCGIAAFNRAVFRFLKTTNYPLALSEDFPLLDNEKGLIREDIFRILTDSGVGVPEYYQKVPFTVDGEIGYYARSRSGCYFCFFQQKIEWVWLYEQHPELFAQAMEYEKEGYTWMQNERLEDLIRPERIEQIKRDAIKRSSRITVKSTLLIDLLADAEGEGCAACFI